VTLDPDEIERIESVFSRRGYDTDFEYNDTNTAYLHRLHSMERATLSALKAVGFERKLAELRVLDLGCGNGRWFGRWLAWGATPSNLTGVDLRTAAIEMAKSAFPQCCFKVMPQGCVPFPDASFDVVCQNLVFSSILDDGVRQAVAVEMMRVLKPGGVILWCDFTYDNPRNPHVRGVKQRDIKVLFPNVEKVVMKSVILAPPIARRVVQRSWLMADLLEAGLPFLRTHIFAALRKKS
jgi:ubiquinone/menaquinone biosynthesis C-methylase UbiE